jgi:DNA-binding Xre family transcriptional regulator
MTRRLFEVALVDEVLAELARQHRTRADLADAIGMHERTLRRRLNGSGEFRAVELDAIAAALDVEVGTLHDRAHATIEAAMRRHPAGSQR